MLDIIIPAKVIGMQEITCTQKLIIGIFFTISCQGWVTISYQDLADILWLTSNCVWKNIKILEEMGLINKFPTNKNRPVRSEYGEYKFYLNKDIYND